MFTLRRRSIRPALYVTTYLATVAFATLATDSCGAAALRYFRTADARDGYHELSATHLFQMGFDAAPPGSMELDGKTFVTGDANFIMRRSNFRATPELYDDFHEDIEIVSMTLVNDTALTTLESPLFVTLQSQRGLNPLDPPPGPRSLGERSYFGSQSWGMLIDIYVDYRLGSREGPIRVGGDPAGRRGHLRGESLPRQCAGGNQSLCIRAAHRRSHTPGPK